ncbi:unnamed protein product [Prorocentrum cordatum]|uniref:Uncharacterized protein n=1 Tax=Prorocentrum cordatum TaxID=2364126 RepID=A0ABN9VRX4_9DINO|nr:unnamed protein product [Polarella glacialis]
MHSLPPYIQAQPLLVSRGAVWGHRPGHLLVPSKVTEEELQPAVFEDLQLEQRSVLFWQYQTPNNAARILVYDQLWHLGTLPEEEVRQLLGFHGELVRHWTQRGANATILPAAATVAGMRRAIFCPAPPGENPSAGTKRLKDAVLAGCLPVVVAFGTSWGSGVSWWRTEGPPLEAMLPFTWEIDWRRLAVEVSYSELQREGGLVDSIARLGRDGVEAKRSYLLSVRDRLVFDFAGRVRDAFSVLMDGVRAALPKLTPSPLSHPQLGHTSGMVCDVLPNQMDTVRWRGSDGENYTQKIWFHPLQSYPASRPTLGPPAWTWARPPRCGPRGWPCSARR